MFNFKRRKKSESDQITHLMRIKSLEVAAWAASAAANERKGANYRLTFRCSIVAMAGRGFLPLNGPMETY